MFMQIEKEISWREVEQLAKMKYLESSVLLLSWKDQPEDLKTADFWQKLMP